jgi:hypothetical protein
VVSLGEEIEEFDILKDLEEEFEEEKPKKPPEKVEKPRPEEPLKEEAGKPEPEKEEEKLPTPLPKPASPLEDLLEKEEVVEEEIKPDDKPIPKVAILIASEKSEGKTTAAYSFPGEMVVLAYDDKALSAKFGSVVKNGKRIDVYLLNKYYQPKDSSDEEIGKAAQKVIDMTAKVLSKLENSGEKPDWIVIDNFEAFIRWAEWAGRYRRRIPIFQKGAKPGQDYWGVYDERNAHIKMLWHRAFGLAKMGVIYTTYIKEVESVITGIKQVPKWVDAVKYETDHHIVVWKEFDEEGQPRYYAKILGTKDEKNFPDGAEFEITNIGFYTALRKYLKRES